MTVAPDAPVLAGLQTEQARPELAELDSWSTEDIVALMAADARRASAAVEAAKATVARAVEEITARMADGGRLVYVGAGTAGRLGLLDAAEAGPTFSVPDGTVLGLMAGGVSAFGAARENAEDDTDAGARALDECGIRPIDTVVGISASGRTPFVLGAVKRANEIGALSVGVSCNVSTPLSAAAQIPIDLAVGPEIVAGSTRLNAGTAQKLVLNAISTTVMIRLGKTYGPLMVDLRATNAKLRTRAIRIVTTVTGAEPAAAEEALRSCGWSAKLACLVLMRSLAPGDAAALLERHKGALRQALAESDDSPS